ncbi:integral membrane protein, putative [Theileria annulata]|uniref:Integral membrane protein, putative n=1 Tax=Theileria annulata TaxID=5874 RepID=Q4UB47_THEAN|nr:integral membrane protein, putative [Theileria annulata]CAI75954.1 integral membrane protein, putative [Theileria annulata]|eukprot:XP_955430.1 integral membrane protein, putative [Theileria annulata]
MANSGSGKNGSPAEQNIKNVLSAEQVNNKRETSTEFRYILLLAIILAGISVLQTKRLVVTCGMYAARRFKIDVALGSLFIKLTLISVEKFFIFGIIFITIYLIVSESKTWDAYLSIALSWLNLIAFCIICVAYFGTGEDANINFYFWSLNLSAFTSGMFFAVVFDLVTKDIVFFLMGIPLSEVSVLIFHLAFEYLYHLFFTEQIEYFIVMNQIIGASGLWLFTALFWTLAFHNYYHKSNEHVIHNEKTLESGTTKDKEKEKMTLYRKFLKVSSPTFIIIFTCFFVYFFHPGILPFDFLDDDTGYYIILIGIGVSAILTVAVIILAFCGSGPNQPWENKVYSYHLLWIFPVIYTVIGVLVIYTIHYPERKISKFIAKNIFIIGFFTVFLKSTGDFNEIVCLSAIGNQRRDDDDDGKLSAGINSLLRILICIIMFVGMGYEKAIHKYNKDRENWPTEGYSWVFSLVFWVGKSLEEGYKLLVSTFVLDLHRVFEVGGPEGLEY